MAGKQDHLLAGKKKLEEFRKKKAAEKARKTASSSHIQPAGTGLPEKQPSQSDPVRVTDSDGAGTSDGTVGSFNDLSSLIVNNDHKTIEFVHKTDSGFSDDTHAAPQFSANNYNIPSIDPFETRSKDEKIQDASTEPVDRYANSMDKRMINNFSINSETSANYADGVAREYSVYPLSVQDSDSSSSKYNNYGLGVGLSSDGNGRFKDVGDAGASLVPDSHGSIPFQKKSSYSNLQANDLRSSPSGDSLLHSTNITEVPSGYGQNKNAVFGHSYNLVPEMDERKFSSSAGHLISATSASMLSSDSRYTGLGFDSRDSGHSANHVGLSPASVGTSTRRSRSPLFDSINASRPSASPLLIETQKDDPFNSKVHPVDVLASSASQDSTNTYATNNGYNLFRHDVHENNIDTKHNFYSAKQNEDFAALEQHIEDLTQEKFSLQRALDASRTLAESLASENSALTDSYNQQGSVVHQLKFDMEKLQEEIKAHLVELESLKGEYTNVQLECNAADERAKLLASEVIGLEEKALRLRSSELKLERQLENSQAEMSSFRKKITSLEKDRQDLQLTIDALQEEKKLLQSKLRKASFSGKFIDASKSSNSSKKNVSTSTDDLVDGDVKATPDTSNHEIHSGSFLNGNDASAETRQHSLEGVSVGVPPDQLRMIQNINVLISELALEKEELIQALSAESSQSSKLKILNNELSRKLEIQTQRLELLTAQSMASDNIPARQTDSQIIPDNTRYADEGDEVVERVLGWIMKLFPGGPSKRRTSKLL